MSVPAFKVIFANDSEVARVARNHLGLVLHHVARRCQCRTENGCRKRMREQIKTALGVLAQEARK